MFVFRLLSYLQSDLDVMLLLESQYSYTKILLNLQRTCRLNPTNYDFSDPSCENQNTDSNEEENEEESNVENVEDIIE